MDAALRELSDQIDQATQRLLDTARIITDPELRVPSLLPGWTRGHVLAHVARNADGMRKVLVGVRAAQNAGRRATEHAADLADSAMALRTVARQLPDEGWQVPVRMLEEGDVFPAAALLTRRLVEVELHHCDLGAGYGPGDWPTAFADMELAEPMRSWRQDRLSYPEPSPLRPARYPAPWQRGRPLPGSWLGTR